MYFTFPYLNRITYKIYKITKFNPKIQYFKRVLGLNSKQKKDWRIQFFQLAFKWLWIGLRAKRDPKVLKQLFFSKNYEKSPSGWELRPQTPIAPGGWGLRPPDPGVWYLWISVHFFTQHVSQFRHFYILTIGLNPPP